MDISIKLILQELVRRAWIIVLCAILGFVAAYAYTKTSVAPVYTTTMKVSALTKVDESSSTSAGTFINMLTLANRRVQVYLELFKTTMFYEQVAQTSGTGYTAGAVGSMLSFRQVEDMGIFYVTITGTDPAAVKSIGDAVAQEMLPYIEMFQNNSAITVIEPAKTPTYPINESLNSNCVKGFLVGALLSVAFFAVIAYFDSHIKDEETLSKRYKNIPILGSIPDFTVITGKR